MDAVFTKYDGGSADATIGRFDISKQFAFGGIYGAMTDVRDVKKGPAANIADILVPAPESATAPPCNAYP